MSGVKKLFGKRVKELRKQNHLTQEKLAELIGIDTRNLIKIENGETFPRVQTLEKLLEVLKIAPYEIFRNEHLDNPEILTADVHVLKALLKLLLNRVCARKNFSLPQRHFQAECLQDVFAVLLPQLR